jgi:hypothetical protein
MSYCRFENTYRDFQDCLEALENDGIESLSDNERYYAEKLLNLSKKLIQAIDSEDSE